MTGLLTKIRCRLGWHKRLDVIQSFGAAEHIGCPECGQRYGIHHGMRACVPWDAEIQDMYELLGYDVEGPLSHWRRVRRAP